MKTLEQEYLVSRLNQRNNHAWHQEKEHVWANVVKKLELKTHARPHEKKQEHNMGKYFMYY